MRWICKQEGNSLVLNCIELLFYLLHHGFDGPLCMLCCSCFAGLPLDSLILSACETTVRQIMNLGLSGEKIFIDPDKIYLVMWPAQEKTPLQSCAFWTIAFLDCFILLFLDSPHQPAVSPEAGGCSGYKLGLWSHVDLDSSLTLPLLAVWPWAIELASLNINFLTCVKKK